MKQLFLKSNLLHIRTNEGEFEVSNPEILSKSDCFNLSRLNGIEWPGGVEFETIAPHPECNKARECLQLTNGLNCSQAYDARTRSTSLCAKSYKLVRLLPKEEKKHEWTTDEIMSMVEKKPAPPTPNFPKGGTTFTESAYKEFEEKKDQYGNPVFDTHEEEAEYRKKTLEMANRIIDGLSVNKANLEHIAQTGKINGSLRQELIDKIFAKSPIAAPSESQEEWISLEIRTPNPLQWVLVWVEAKLMAFMACRRAYPSEQGSMWDSPFEEVELYNSEIDYWRPIPKFTRKPE